MRLHVYVLELLREFFLHLHSFSTEGGSCSDRFCSGQSRPPHPPPPRVQCDQSSLWIFISLSRSITAVVQAFGWLYTVWSVDTFSGLVATTAFETARCWIENWIFGFLFWFLFCRRKEETVQTRVTPSVRARHPPDIWWELWRGTKLIDKVKQPFFILSTKN